MNMRTRTPVEKKQYATSCVFFAGQPEDKGGRWRISIIITTKLHNYLSVSPTNQVHPSDEHKPYIKGTRNTRLEIKFEQSRNYGHFWQESLTKTIKEEKIMTRREVSTFDDEIVEGPIYDSVYVNELIALKAENIELRNALNEKNRILHSKENRIVELEREVVLLRGEVRYCQNEIYRLDVFRTSQDIRIPKNHQDGM